MSETALTKINEPLNPATAVQEFSAFGNITDFTNAQRMAMALCKSSIVPSNYQGEANIGSCVIALEISNRIGASVLAVMQNLYVVHGKPGWSSQFLISCVNASRKFTPLRYRMTGTKGQDDWGCIAWATDKTGEMLEAPEITIKMAKAEGWYGKNGSKWQTLPELMLRYRTATLFARLYAPELTMGIQTAEEIADVVEIQAVTTPAVAPSFTPKRKKEAQAVVVPLTNPEPIDTVSGDVTVVEKTPAPDRDPSFEEVVDGAENPDLVALREAMKAKEVTEAQVWEFSNKKGLLRPGIEFTKTLTDVRVDKFKPLTTNINAAGATLKAIKGEV